ncbi:MAG TPA: ATP-dependent helicase [Casimicrobiaceae bacterium]|nr:ATP-dependent helicase [Casimicrobiaceae bacterium]
MDSLNEAQSAAVHDGAGVDPPPPLLVIAGAGSGKTHTLAHRVARLVHDGADPYRILLLTFSRRSAAEMERRAGRALQAMSKARGAGSPPALPWSGTFHSVGARLLREYAERIGLATNFTVHDRGDSEDLMGLVRQPLLGADATRTRVPGAATCLAIYSLVVSSGRPLDDVLADSFPWCAHLATALEQLCQAYVDAKQSQHVLDFDDLLLYWAATMRVPELAREIGGRFDHVLVDEYQDTNRLQGDIVRLLKPEGAGVTVVGDDAQAIYAFRAATVRNILDFPAQYDPPAHVVTLDRNYRSTQRILDASNAVIALAREGYAKALVTDRVGGERPRLVTVEDEMRQSECVAEEVLRQRENGVALKRQAVLFRTSSHSAALELELARRNIPFVKFGGLRFLDAAHVKDVLSILRWIENPRARLAGFRALRLLPGIGPATATRWLDQLAPANDVAGALAALRAPEAARGSWANLVSLHERLREGSAWPTELDAIIAWYEPHLARLYDDAPLRAPDLVQLRRIAATYPSRERFLTELALDPPAATSAEAEMATQDEDYLTLSTIHSAKGQEWNVVQVLNCVDGCIPSDMSTRTTDEIEEERRLLYVAMTRAKDVLALLLPQRFYVRQQSAGGDRHVYASRSRFLTDDVCRHFDACTWPEAPRVEAREAAMAGVKVDLRAVIRSAWGAQGPSSAR